MQKIVIATERGVHTWFPLDPELREECLRPVRFSEVRDFREGDEIYIETSASPDREERGFIKATVTRVKDGLQPDSSEVQYLAGRWSGYVMVYWWGSSDRVFVVKNSERLIELVSQLPTSGKPILV